MPSIPSYNIGSTEQSRLNAAKFKIIKTLGKKFRNEILLKDIDVTDGSAETTADRLSNILLAASFELDKVRSRMQYMNVRASIGDKPKKAKPTKPAKRGRSATAERVEEAPRRGESTTEEEPEPEPLTGSAAVDASQQTETQPQRVKPRTELAYFDIVEKLNNLRLSMNNINDTMDSLTPPKFNYIKLSTVKELRKHTEMLESSLRKTKDLTSLLTKNASIPGGDSNYINGLVNEIDRELNKFKKSLDERMTTYNEFRRDANLQRLVPVDSSKVGSGMRRMYSVQESRMHPKYA